MKGRILPRLLVALCLAALYAAGASRAVPVGQAWSPQAAPLVAPSLGMAPASSVLHTGDTFSIVIVVADVADLGGFDLTVAFNPAVLRAQGASLYTFLGSTGRSTGWSSSQDNAAGTVRLVAQSSGADPGPSGSGNLAQVQFQAVGAGSSTLTFSAAALRDTQDTLLGPLVLSGGTATVTDPEGVISGTVSYEDGTPAGDVRVTAAPPDEPGDVQWWAWTAADGSYSLPGAGQPPLYCNHWHRVTPDPATIPAGYTWSPLAADVRWCLSTMNWKLLPFTAPPPAPTTACDPPAITSPISTTVPCGSEVTLRWTGSCAEYDVEYEYWSGEERRSSGWISASAYDFVVPYYDRRGDTILWWHVRGRDATGAETAWSDVGLVVVEPAPPQNVRAAPVSCDELALQWDASSCYPCVDYAAECRGGDGSWGSCRVEAPLTACTVGGLHLSTTYSCTVTCVGKSDTATSAVVTATTLGAKTEQEAEDGLLVAPLQVGTDPEASGGQYVYSPLGNEGRVTLKLCVPQAGSYELWGRVRGLGWGADTFFVTVDGGDPVLWEVPIGPWEWAPVSHREDSTHVVQVYPFTAGGHRIQVDVREAAAELDLIELRVAGLPTLTPTATSPATPTPTATPPLPTVTPTATPPPPTVTPTATPPGDVMVSGVVYDAALGPGHGIAGVTVAVVMCQPRSFTVVSAADGSYSLLLPALYVNQCAEVTLEAAKAGYQPWSQVLTVAALRAQPVRDLALVALPTPTISPTATPVHTCTPPPCPPPGVLYCPGECPGGCGYWCLQPTATPTPLRWRQYLPVLLRH